MFDCSGTHGTPMQIYILLLDYIEVLNEHKLFCLLYLGVLRAMPLYHRPKII